MKAIITVGVSGSGKSYWAEQFCEENPDWVNINRDDLRWEWLLGNPPEGLPGVDAVASYADKNLWSVFDYKLHEPGAKKLWENDVESLTQGVHKKNVIFSDTNLSPKTRKHITDLLDKAGYEWELKFFPIDYKTAVERDAKRRDSVGAFVIAEQLEKYWEQFEGRYIPDTSKPKAVIVDIDGTLAHNTSRHIFDWSKVFSDTPDREVIDVVTSLRRYCDYHLLITSGRDGVAYDMTKHWLKVHLGEDFELFMRAPGDRRKDSIVKKELFDSFKNDYNVTLAIDDRPQVVRLWRSLGIKTLALGNQHKEF